MWGVRINESRDDHELYTETNKLARQLDSTRPTTGIRCITGSEMSKMYMDERFYI